MGDEGLAVDHPFGTVLVAVQLAIEGQRVDCGALRVLISARVDMLEAHARDGGPGARQVAAATTELYGAVDGIEVGDFEAASESLKRYAAGLR